MSERITEAEVRDFADTPMLPGVDGCVMVPMPAGFRERLIEDWRRLRGLIERAWPHAPGEPLMISHPRFMDASDAGLELHAEAEAIRAERGR